MKILRVWVELLNLTERYLTKVESSFAKICYNALKQKDSDKYSGINTAFISSSQYNYSIILTMATCSKHTGHQYDINCYTIYISEYQTLPLQMLLMYILDLNVCVWVCVYIHSIKQCVYIYIYIYTYTMIPRLTSDRANEFFG